MAKNRNQPDNQERPKQGTSGKEAGQSQPQRGQEKGSEGSASPGRTGGADRGIDRSRTEPKTDEPTRKGRGKEASETEGLDVDELDEQNQEL